MARLMLIVSLLAAACSCTDAFAVNLPRITLARSRALVCAVTASAESNIALSADLSRRSFVAVSLASFAGVQSARAAEENESTEADSADEVVVEGEMRLEVGSDKKLAKIGGKAKAEVVLRCVGKGIISKTSEEIDLKDFPAPGRPGADGEAGGVPFSVTVADLVEKTEKGRIVNRELWGDDDIFVAVDVYPIDNPKKRILCVIHAHKSDDGIINMAVCIAGRRGIGKAKYKDGVHQKPLVLLE